MKSWDVGEMGGMKWDEDRNNILMGEKGGVCAESETCSEKSETKRKTERKEPDEPRHERAKHGAETTKGAAENKPSPGKTAKRKA
jgi:hypothetical protein